MALSIANSDPTPSIKTITQIEQQLETEPQEWEEQPFIVELPKRRKKRLEASRKPPEPEPVYIAPVAPAVPYTAPTAGELTGSVGYALAYGNCVNQVPVGLRGFGNPINWPVLTQTPYIGGAALWYFNHTGRVVGIWSNGDLEIAHENAGGWGQTRFPRSAFRGFR